MTSEEGGKIENGWKSAGIFEALTKGVDGLDPLDPFAPIDPLDSSPSVNGFDHPQPTIGTTGEISNFLSPQPDNINESDDEWEGRN